MVLQKAYVPLMFNSAFTDVQFTHSVGTNTMTGAGILYIALMTTEMALYFFGLENTTSIISKDNLKGGLSPSKMSFSPEKSAVFLDVVDIWLLICRVLTCICGCSDCLCVLRRVF